MNQPLTNTQAISQRIESKLDPVSASELSLTNAAGGLNLENMGQVMDLAKMMAISDVAVRKHLRNNPGACLAVAVQAFEWKMSPFAVANKSYVVNDQLAYEAQLIQAVITMRAPIIGRVKSEYTGEGAKRKIRVWAQTTDLEEVSYESPEIGNINPKNSPLWKNDPDQQLHYFAVRSWCRRHFPDVILGVYATDELEDSSPMRDVSPAKPSGLAARLGGAKAETGFNAAGVEASLGGQPQSAAAPSIDWSDASAATAAIQGGTFPAGYSRNAEGALVVPEAGQQIPEHGIIVSLFREVRAADGSVLKTAKPKADEKPKADDKPTTEEAPDPEVMRDAASAALSGGERAAPEGMSEAQTAFWLAEFDRVLADAEAHG